MIFLYFSPSFHHLQIPLSLHILSSGPPNLTLNMVAPDTLDQSVKAGNLILVRSDYKDHMLLVDSVDNDKDPKSATSSIIVEGIPFDTPDKYYTLKEGHWSFSGPQVFYMGHETDSDSDSDCTEPAEPKAPKRHRCTLSTVLSHMVPEEKKDDGNEEIVVTVNPHGRFAPFHLYILTLVLKCYC